MRLSELRPELHTDGCEPGEAWLWFDCPHCRDHHLIQVPIRRGDHRAGAKRWGWNGETDFEKLTLSPSLNCARHWHGFVRNGGIETVG